MQKYLNWTKALVGPQGKVMWALKVQLSDVIYEAPKGNGETPTRNISWMSCSQHFSIKSVIMGQLGLSHFKEYS